MLGSNNYLGLTGDARVKEAARDALERYGTGLTGSRFLNGTLSLHLELERELAEWMGTEDALVFTTGYLANIGAIGTLLGPGDTVICDSGDHASILDAVSMSRARIRPFRHNRLDKLETMLQRAEGDGGGVLVVVDGVFSMEGDVAPLPDIAALCREHGARLMVDEAHGVGVLGARGAGACELLGRRGPGGPAHGHVLEVARLLRRLHRGPRRRHRLPARQSRSFMFTAAAVPAAIGAALGALRDHPLRRGPAAVGEGARQRPLPARRAGRPRLPGDRADPAAGRLRRHHADRPRARRRRLEGGAAVEGALRRRRVRQRRDLPGRAARRRAAAHERHGHARARAPRPRPRRLRASQGRGRERRAARLRLALYAPAGSSSLDRPPHFARPASRCPRSRSPM